MASCIKLDHGYVLMCFKRPRYHGSDSGFNFLDQRLLFHLRGVMPELLDARSDEYGGVIINPESLPMSANAFASAVQASLSNWKLKGKRGVWLKILQQQADLVPIAIQSEDIFSGAMIEVRKETGIKMVAFRHAHKVAFEQSDLLFVCMLKPLSSDITIDEKEIQSAKWMAVDEFIEQPYYEDDHLSNKLIELCTAAHRDKYSGFIGHQLISKIDGKSSFLYL